MPTASHLPDTTTQQLRARTAAAADAAPALAAMEGAARARLLRAVADAIDGERDTLAGIADEETSLGATRLRGEVARTTGQLRLFAEVLEEGSYLEAVIDTADPAATPPRPDVRRMLHPLGPVAVFAASNFPFAFSVAGGDTASALAAGCPVVVKAHPGHPALSAAVAGVVEKSLRDAGAPPGAFALVAGYETGTQLVADPAIRAVGFTGSLAGGRALHDVAVSRPDPIPFYGELGSINPVIVTPAAAERRGQEIAEGLVGSFTLGTGQFCTKPGIVFVPAEAGLEQAVAAAVGSEPLPLLNARIAEGFASGLRELLDSGRVEVLAGSPPSGKGSAAVPVVLASTIDDLLAAPDALLQECFGPVTVLVRYGDETLLRSALDLLPGSLAITVHGEDDEAERIRGLLGPLGERAGRLVWNGWPTGVAVTWSMHHGGPWPATTAPLHTSVGATAIRRFLRPVAYQSWPQALLPAALRDGNPLGLPRRLDGRMTTEPLAAP